MPALVALIIGWILGRTAGGTLRGLGALRLRFESLILPLFVVQALARGRVLGAVGASRWPILVWVVSSTLLVVMLLANSRVPGMALGAVGVLVNVDIVVINSAMPLVVGGLVHPATPASAGELASTSGHFYRVAGQGDLFTWLGDVIPLELGRSIMLFSPGDVALLVGVAVAVAYAMKNGGGQDNLTRVSDRESLALEDL